MPLYNVLLVVILGSGLQFIALNWRIMEKNLSKLNGLILTAIIISFLCFTLPFLGEYLAFEIRVVMITLSPVVMAWVAYRYRGYSKKDNRSNPGYSCSGFVFRVGAYPADGHPLFKHLDIL